MSIPRNEYPRPQMVRGEWLNLNGTWQFEIDNSKSGKEKAFFDRESLNDKITLPFCPESFLSGVVNTEFMYCVWYKRLITIPKGWTGKNIIFHIGAADYKTSVYINGSLAGEHKGGYTAFSFDITAFVKDGENDITVCCEDNYSGSDQPFGKQSRKLNSYGCYYTRTTGIWQTVWLEAVDSYHIKNIKLTPDADNSVISALLTLSAPIADGNIDMTVSFEGSTVGCAKAVCKGNLVNLSAKLSETHLWQVGCGNLYDIDFRLFNGVNMTDSVSSYFGLRSITLESGALCINHKPVFMRLVLDQGFYPDGIYTAPSEEALKNDILYSLELGFNGARPHEKVFEPLYLYWADKLGYIVWGEYANWGFDHTKAENIYNFLPEWIESVNRDYSHPSIVGWCPFNETWDIANRAQYDGLISMVYDVTKQLDPTRPCIDTSGNFHVRTDIFDIHDYAQDKETFSNIFSQLDEGIVKDQVARRFEEVRQTWKGEPLFVSEYGGIKWDTANISYGWGYGKGPSSEEEFKERYKTLTEILLKNKHIMGFCYTQLYDVEQEINGLMTYDRKYKFDPKFFCAVNTQIAAIEIS